MEKVSSVFIEGRSWLDKTYGNSYWSARIWVNGRVIGRIPFSYGYGSQYRHVSLVVLKSIGWLTEANGWYFAPDGSPVVIYDVNTYGLKREMFSEMDFETYGQRAA